MSPLYLRYRNNALDPWVEVPSLTFVIPGQPVGSLSLEGMTHATEPTLVSVCGCSDPSAADNKYVMRAGIAAVPQSASLPIITFLLAYKQAAFHEAKHDRYTLGVYISTDLHNFIGNEENGVTNISFRLIAALM